MSRISGNADRVNRGISRHHVLVGALALAVSFGFHATLFSSIESLPLLPKERPGDVRRFASIEMRNVQRTPPVRDTIDRASLDDPDAAIPLREEDEGLSELSAPEPPRLALPAPEEPAPPPAAPDRGESGVPPAVRQEVLAIQDQRYADEISALPRRWIDGDIPRIEKAPDIQLPVMVPEEGAGTRDAAGAAASAYFIEDPEAGTPDWSAILFGRTVEPVDAAPVIPQTRDEDLDTLLDEKPKDVSELQPIENLLQVKVAGYNAPDEDGSLYFALHIERASKELLPVQPRDILFIQDCSESMTAWKLDECRRGLKRWLDYLGEGDRFEILGFRETILPCFGGWRPFTAESRRDAYGFIDGLRAVGNTDVYKSIQSAMSIQPESGRTMLVVLITDGRPTVGVTGSSDIIDGVTRANQGRVSIFTVGGGKKVNSFFLDLLSYRNRGDAVVVREQEEIPGAMEMWAQELERPVLTDLSYRFANMPGDDVFPRQLTHLFLDRPLVIHGKLPADSDRFVFQVVGRAGEDWHDMIFVIERDRIASGSKEIREQWAWQKIYHMIGEYIAGETPEKLETIRQFADRYGLIVPYGFSRALPRSYQ